MKHKVLLGLLILLFGIQINGAQAQQPVVYAVLFFSPSCGHCHYVITEVLPPLQEEYGEQLQVLYIDVSQPEGSTLFHAAFDALNIPDNRRGYVPTMVIGTTFWVGSGDIPEQMPGVVRDGIASGGIDLPPIPGLREIYEAVVVEEQTSQVQNDSPSSGSISTTYQKNTWQDRLKQDRLGNSFALGVLGILVIGLGVQIQYGARLFGTREGRHGEMGRTGWLFVLALAIITTIIAGTLALESSTITLPAVLAAGVTVGMIRVVWAILQSRQTTYVIPGWVLPMVACLGLVVAGYLAYVEVGENEAVCGAVGDCQTVQQSEYARLFGLIPIGVFGVLGYFMILAAWGISRYVSGWIAHSADAVLLGFGLFGVLFSLYLTFLEPFVIGATCAWCLTSAMMMILILSLQAPAGWAAVNYLADRLTLRPYRTTPSDWENKIAQE